MSNKPVYRQFNLGLLVLLTCVFEITLQAQWRNTSLHVPAKLITKSNDTILVNMHLTNQFDIQYRFEASDTSGNVTNFTPIVLQCFSFTLGETHFLFQSVSNPDGQGHIFLRKIHSGSLSVYEFQKMDPQRSVPFYITFYYFKRADWILPSVGEDDDRSQLLPYFIDCPSVQQKIKEGYFEVKDLPVIMNTYENCEKLNPYEFLNE